jgi:hypothetical protein
MQSYVHDMRRHKDNMQRYVHNENVARYQKLIAASELDPSRDEDRHKMLLALLAEEKAKDKQKPLDI